eukprot:gb/GEZN01007014.1/.p1 GENE.gb/GEZN01007014.1/~~gb/GEZN01007014.1/.p1  ORF type:complete len:438 (+),score=56.36 gb/GEZN01007014.1/:55-1368(+)
MLLCKAVVLFFIAELCYGSPVGFSQNSYDDRQHDIGIVSKKCVVGDGQACDIRSFEKRKNTLVYPGGRTRCLKHNSPPFAFQVLPKDLSKIHIHLQAGGACWDAITTWLPACSTRPYPVHTDEGIFDDQPSNPYKDYTVVAVLYCSGDAHIGNVTRPYDDEPGSGYPALQVGTENVLSTLEWVLAQQLGRFQDLLITGTSAGAMGVQPWGLYILQKLPYQHASVIVDSYAGVIDCMGALIARFGGCNSVLMDVYPGFVQQKCLAESLRLEDLVPMGLLQDPKVVWSFLQSKYDAVQITYYAAVAALCLEAKAKITPEWFYAWVNQILEYYRFYPNFQLFLVNSDKHMYLTGNDVYKATTTSSVGGSPGDPSMLAFIQQQQASHNASVVSQCHGAMEYRNTWSGYLYCDAVLFPNSIKPATANNVTNLESSKQAATTR